MDEVTVHLYVTHPDGEADLADVTLPGDTDLAEVRAHVIEQWGGNFIPGDVIDLTIEGHFAPFDSFTHEASA